MDKIWSPDVQIVNRGHEFPHNEEYQYKAKIYSSGYVYAIRNYRFKADINVDSKGGSLIFCNFERLHLQALENFV